MPRGVPEDGTRDPYGNGKEFDPMLNGQYITGKVVDSDTRGIREFVLEDGSHVMFDDAVELIRNKQSTGLILQNGPNGLFIRTKPDGDEGNNLDMIPNVESDTF